MPTSLPAWRSLKTRLTLTTLLLFGVGLWLLAFYLSRTLQADLQRLLTDQQTATVAAMAADVDRDLRDRLVALEKVAERLGLAETEADLQTFLEARPALQSLFNGGTFITRSEGTAAASVPRSVGRQGVNYLDRDYIATPLREGKAKVGQPTLGRKLGVPIFGLGVPIRDAQGKVIGALAGVINLGQPGFLDQALAIGYGKSGYFLLEEPVGRMVITSSDKGRVMQPLPAPGINPLIDRHVQGFDETGITRNPSGVEVLATAKRIPAAGWFLVAALPTAEAFAPLRAMQLRILGGTVLLTLLVGALTWWLLRRHLAPMLTTVQTLEILGEAPTTALLLPITRQDEVGRLIGAFNGLLQALAQGQAVLAESETKYRTLVDNLLAGLVVHGADTSILFANAAASVLLGLSPDQMAGKTALDPRWCFLQEDGLPMPLADYPVNRVLASGEGFQGQVLGISRPDRPKPVWVLCNAYPVKDDQGRCLQAVITFADITEQKQAQADLAASEANLAITLHSIGDAVIATDTAGRITRMNPTAERLTAWPLADALGQPLTSVFRIISAETRRPSIDPVQAVLAHGEVVGLANHTALLARDGHEYQIADSAAPIRDAAGQIVGVVLVFSDVTEQYRVAEFLRESEERWKFAIEGAGDGLWDWNLHSGKAFFSPRYKSMLGFAEEEIGESADEWNKRIHPEDAAGVFAALQPFMDGKPGAAEVEFRMQCKDGSWLWILGRGMVVQRDGDGKPLRMIGTNSDITERKQAEERLSRSDARHSAMVANIGDVIVIVDANGVNRYKSPNIEKWFGWKPEDVIGVQAIDNIHPEDRDSAREFLGALFAESNAVGTMECRYQCKDGGYKWIEFTGANLQHDPNVQGILGNYRDISERKLAEDEKHKLKAQLQQSQKMESLGTLAGGVAHDMNNVLGAILGLASAHIGTQSYGSPVHQALDTICKATERGGRMVKSLLSFARQSPAESRQLDMNALLKEQIALLERTTLAKVRLEIDLEADLRPILGDASALTHAFLNLCVNAVDAMPENGTLTLHTRNVDNDWIEVVVEDNGMGMPKDVLEKAMEPFFTTKETGKGTGLGLSMVFSTVKAHRGQMAIESEPDQGTRVMLRFPACEPAAPVQAAAPALAEAPLPPQGALKVLLVDDDELIQSSVQMLLEVLGHTVRPAQSGEAALAMLAAGFAPDLVLLDMNMPGLGGIGTLPRLRALRPEVPVLLATGRVDQTALTLAAAHTGVTLLAKPFGLRELQKHLENLGLG